MNERVGRPAHAPEPLTAHEKPPAPAGWAQLKPPEFAPPPLVIEAFGDSEHECRVLAMAVAKQFYGEVVEVTLMSAKVILIPGDADEPQLLGHFEAVYRA